MLKKSFLIIVVLVLIVSSCVSCQKQYGETLTAEEIELLKAVEDDIQVVHEPEYVSTLTVLQSHSHDYEGQIFQLEGVYSEKYGHGETPCVYRSVMMEGDEWIYSMLITGFNKEISEGSWIRVTGILSNKADDHGHTNVVLDVLAIEVLSSEGNPLIDAD